MTMKVKLTKESCSSYLFGDIEKDVVWYNGLCYAPSCANCKHATSDGKDFYKVASDLYSCALCCREFLDDYDTCDRFVFVPRVAIAGFDQFGHWERKEIE